MTSSPSVQDLGDSEWGQQRVTHFQWSPMGKKRIVIEDPFNNGHCSRLPYIGRRKRAQMKSGRKRV